MLTEFDYNSRDIGEYGPQEFWKWIRGIAAPIAALDSWCVSYEEAIKSSPDKLADAVRNANCVGNKVSEIVQTGERKKLVHLIKLQQERIKAMFPKNEKLWILPVSKMPVALPCLSILDPVNTVIANRRLTQIQMVLYTSLAVNNPELCQETTKFIISLPRFNYPT